MVVNDYLTLFLTLQAWVISNKIFYLLSSANLLVLPMVIIVFNTMTEAMQEGEDEGNKGLLSLNRSAVGLVLAIAAYVFAMHPSQELRLSTMVYNDVRSEQCGVSSTKPGDNTGTSWDSSFESLGGETAKVPAWWKLIHGISVGTTNASVAAIPCSYDITRSQLKLSEVSIDSPALQQETQQFYEQCFANAKSAMVRSSYQNQGSISDSDFDKALWLGDEYFLSTNNAVPHTTYRGIKSLEPVPTFPYNATRDSRYNKIWAERLGKSEADTKAYPTCYEWWKDTTYGLRERLAKEIKENSPEIYVDIMMPNGWFDKMFKGEVSAEERKDMLIQRALSTENINATGRTTRGYGAVINSSGSDRATAEMWGSTVGGAGLLAGRTFMEPTFFIVREALPIFQALILSMLIIAIPLILPMALYQWRVLITVTIAYFGVQYFTFWWEWCRSLESKLLSAMHSGHDFNFTNPISSFGAGTMNALDSEILRVVLLILYIVVPVLWLSIVGFAGYQVSSLSSAFNTGLNHLKQGVNKGTEMMTSMATGKAQENIKHQYKNLNS
ncbi:conjugal transfer protein TraG [Shewanella sairae]|uniref:Conjugal transfer protein TraG n=1 Tax=Shewanella sairae TaxID=190310 RepID=A0ABQ4P5T7_9GAMM|nr:conjugal transfer protein TraG N-terminal domain-containing protein [Shewanella sairae]MCL1130462.1 conjugal transfer protein TraG N-terminal domain-containing protein [Shewanella sairae]GIU42824.1 conjugal transfer protein TraG [Shewanella sairae]